MPRRVTNAFFIDNASRGDKTQSAYNSFKGLLKASINLYTGIAILNWPSYARTGDWSGATAVHPVDPSVRVGVVQLMGLIFIARIMQQQLFWSRRFKLIEEVLLESGVLIPASLLSLVHLAVQHGDAPMGLVEQVGCGVFLAGTHMNIVPELQRHWWKQGQARAAAAKPGTKVARLYTEGWFAWSRHPNYAGEILSFVGCGLLTGTALGQWVAVAMGAGIAHWSVPELENYLKTRYGDEWTRYEAEVTAEMIPGLW